MAILTVKITGLPEVVSLQGSDIIEIVADADGTPTSKQATLSQLLDWLSESGGLSGGGGGGSGGLSGSGSPEGAQAADPGTTYLDVDTEAFYVKKTGSGNTGWVELIAGI